MNNINKDYILFIKFSSFLIPTILFTNYILNQIYVDGSDLLDVGWFTYLFTEILHWPVQNPEAIGGTFFKTHFFLFFYILSYVHQYILFFIPAPMYYSIFIGSMYGLISLSVFLIALNLIDFLNAKKLSILFFISIVSSINGAALELIGIPHIEIAIPALMLLFFAFYLTNKKTLSFFVFSFLLTIKEDAGFHIFALIMIIIVSTYIVKRKVKDIDYTLLFLAIIGFLYSIVVIYIQKKYFTGDNILERIYLGTPYFAHIKYSFLIDRLNYFYLNREYLYIPMLFSVILSIYTKNIFLLSSVVASLLWFFLSIIAILEMLGTFSNYYAFVFVISSVWPIFSFLIAKKTYLIKSDYFKSVIISVIFITGSFILLFPQNGGNVDSKSWKNFIFTNYKTIVNTEFFVKYFAENKAKFGNILFDEPSSVLFVKKLSKDEYGYLNNFSKNIKDKADTIIFYNTKKSLNKPSVKIMKSIIFKNNLRNIYIIKKPIL